MSKDPIFSDIGIKSISNLSQDFKHKNKRIHIKNVLRWIRNAIGSKYDKSNH